jgi:hypothetical protein
MLLCYNHALFVEKQIPPAYIYHSLPAKRHAYVIFPEKTSDVKNQYTYTHALVQDIHSVLVPIHPFILP